MYVVDMDKSWWQTPFLFHKRVIRTTQEIALLRRYGIRQVSIDPTRGIDVEDPLPPAASKPEVERQRDEGAHGVSYPSEDTQNGPPPTCESQEPPVYAPDPPNNDKPHIQHSLSNELPLARAVRTEALAAVQSVFEGVKTGAPIDSPAIKAVVGGLLDSIMRRPEASLMLTQMRQFDADLLAHAVDVCVVSLVVGKEQNLTTTQLKSLGVGALLHDIGKMRLPRNLLHKPQVSSERERALLQEHPTLGAAILARSEDIPEESRRIVVEHHEYADGSGYPAGRTLADLSPLSQVVSIVDAYDAMVSGRAGQPVLCPTYALRQLYQLGKARQFDSTWVERVIRSLGVYPVGTLVELNTGEKGVVIAINSAETLRPTVRLLEDSDHRPYPEAMVIDLAAPGTGETERMIVRALEPPAAKIHLTHYFEERS